MDSANTDPIAFVALSRIKGRLSSFKISHYVTPVDEFPMTSSGKIRKVEQRAQAQNILVNA